MSAMRDPDLSVLDVRPTPGTPRPYHFPGFTRERLPNGLTILASHLPERPLLAVQLILDGGAVSENPSRAGVTSLMAEGLTEGTAVRDAVAFVEAAERLGASLHADGGWETVTASAEVPKRRLGPAVGLLAEMLLQPTFPVDEIDRLRAERLNDLLQAKAEPRRRAERVFAESVYAASSPYARLVGGTESTVPGLDRATVVERHAEVLDPRRATLIVAGDLRDVPVADIVTEHLGAWTADGASERRSPADATPNPAGARVVIVDRPGSPQTEVRIGHVGLPRRIPDYHAVVVMSAILGGLFNSRLQRLLREERGYTYGVGAGFDLRRAPGPFAVRMAVQTEVTAPAVSEALGVLRGMHTIPPTADELDAARDYLIGVFPLRFESPSQVVSAIGGLVVFDLPDDELDRYRPAVAAVTSDEVMAAARHVRPDDALVVLVGDAARIEADIRATGLGPIEVIREPLPAGDEGGVGDVPAETEA